MEIENQVCNLELAKKLKELGFKQDSLWWWDKEKNGLLPHGYFGLTVKENPKRYISAFTVTELGEMLPMGYASWHKYYDKDDWVCESGDENHHQLAKTEADCRAKMLIYLIENKKIEIKNE